MTTVEQIQAMMQDTSGGGDDESETSLNVAAVPVPVPQTANCSGTNGCGKDFPADEHGADFRFSLLCASCFKKESMDSSVPQTVTCSGANGCNKEFPAGEVDDDQLCATCRPPAAPLPDAVPQTATCSGANGCGKEFPAGEVDDDQLCATCRPPAEPLPDAVPQTATCSGANGCGKEFPADEVDDDQLCDTCRPHIVPLSGAAEPLPGAVPQTATCSGTNGCGKEFPAGEVDGDHLCVICVKAKSEEDEESNESATTEAGMLIGEILSNVRDCRTTLYDVECGGNVNVYETFIDDQDNITGKSKKFFLLVPSSTPLLYAYKHYHAMLNKRSGRGWLGHCRLVSTMVGAEGNGYVMWEFWETRCDAPRLDGILIRPDGVVVLIKRVETWLIKNELSSDVDNSFDLEFYAG
jgi:hypothetical protein